MRTLLVLLVAACLAAPALAILPSPFIGGNLQVNSPTGKFSQTDIVNKEGGAKTGPGGELDLGISTGAGELYAGYRFGKLNVKASYDLPGQSSVGYEGNWKINRFVIGARAHLLGSLPISPTIGGGITLGKTELNIDAVAADTSAPVAQTSSNKMGWFLEAGAVVQIPRVPLSIVGDVQFHQFDAEFATPVYGGNVKISFFTFQAGLRYHFIGG